jgi:hypothetical protein
MGQLQARQITGDNAISKILGTVLEQNLNMRERLLPPEQHMDYLFNILYCHVTKDSDCKGCGKDQLVKQQPRDSKAPVIRFGLVASGDRVVKDSKLQD